MLMNLLIAGAGDITAFGDLRDLSRTEPEHRRLDLDGCHYSSFGLALSPALRRTPGPALLPETIAGWCDTYWLIIAAVVAEPDHSGPDQVDLRPCEARPVSRPCLVCLLA